MLVYWNSKKNDICQEIESVEQEYNQLQKQTSKILHTIRTLKADLQNIRKRVEDPLFNIFADIFSNDVIGLIQDFIDFQVCLECRFAFSKFSKCWHDYLCHLFVDNKQINFALLTTIAEVDMLHWVFLNWQDKSMWEYLNAKIKQKNLVFGVIRRMKTIPSTMIQQLPFYLQIETKSIFNKESQKTVESFQLSLFFRGNTDLVKIFTSVARHRSDIKPRKKLKIMKSVF